VYFYYTGRRINLPNFKNWLS